MRYEDFAEWLENGEHKWNPKPDAIQRYIGELETVVAAEGDLDDKFGDGELEGIFNKYEYTQEDAMANWGKEETAEEPINPTKLKMHPALLLRDLTKFRSRINQYMAFCKHEEAKRLKEGTET